MTATTFDPAHQTSTTLSGGNLIATSTGAGGTYSSRMAQGPFYFEVTPTTLTGTPSVGLACAWNTSTALQSGTNTLAFLPTGAVQVNGTTLATIATYAQGNRIDCCCDPANRLFWARVAGGSWNNNAANNPAIGTETGGIDISSMALGTVAAAVYASLTGNVWSAAFSAASFAGAAPSGYSSLDVIQYTLARNVDVPFEANPVVAQSLGPAARNLLPPYQAAQLVVLPSGGKTIRGVTDVNGVPTSGLVVYVYDHATGALLGSTVSGASGVFSIGGLPPNTVFAVSTDLPTYNAQIFDGVAPV